VIGYRSGPAMASADRFRIDITGRQTHGAMPWLGVDPIVTAAQVVLGLQTIVSRQVDITQEPAVVTVGAIKGGNRENIIPDSVEMIGTIRTFDEGMRDDIHARVKETAESIAKAGRAGCEVCIRKDYPVTVNDAQLTEAMLPTLERVAGAANVMMTPKVTGSEDFSFFQHVVPGLFFFVGVTPAGQDPRSAAPNHSPLFRIDEAGLALGARALAQVACDFLEAPPERTGA
jgi:amidohydrolase